MASISDFARVMPMLVPRPPLSLTITASSSGASAAGSSRGIDEVVDRLEVGLGQHPRRPGLELAVVVGEGRDRGVRDALATHLLLGGLQALGRTSAADRSRPRRAQRPIA